MNDEVIRLGDMSGVRKTRGRPRRSGVQIATRRGSAMGRGITSGNGSSSVRGRGRGIPDKSIPRRSIRVKNQVLRAQRVIDIDDFEFTNSDDEDWLVAEGRPAYYDTEDDVDSTITEEVESESEMSDGEMDHGTGGEIHEEVDLEIANDHDGMSDADSAGSEVAESSDEEFMNKANLRRSMRENADPFRGIYDNQYNPSPDGVVNFQVGQVFLDVVSFREALKDYAIKGACKIKMLKNDLVRVTTKCFGDLCNWRIHATLMTDGITFRVKTLRGEHSCVRNLEEKNINVNMSWIAKKLADQLRADPAMSYELMEHELSKKWGVNPPKWQLGKAKAKAREENEGIH